MPFASLDQIPPYVKVRSRKEQHQWMAIWNSVFRKTGSEKQAYMAANGAVNLSRDEIHGEPPITCFASCVFPDWEAAGSYEVQVMRTGLWKDHPEYGDILITNGDLAEAVRNFRSSSLKPFLDYNHAITARDVKPGDQEAIGWMANMWIENLDGETLEPAQAEEAKDGVLVLKAQYEVNAEANEKIREKKYALFSPTWYRIYQNEETGEYQGMTVIGGAATNVPYFNGMQGFIAIANSRVEARAMQNMLPQAMLNVTPPEDMEFPDAVKALVGLGYDIVEYCEDDDGEDVYRIRSTESEDMVSRAAALEAAGFDVEYFCQGYPAPVGMARRGRYPLEAAVWTTAYVNNLPDGSFAYVEPGEKDGEGKTTPRSKRHLPYKDADGKVDAPHVRDALSRVDQTDIPAAAKAVAKEKLESAAKGLGIGTEKEKGKSMEKGREKEQGDEKPGTFLLERATTSELPMLERVPVKMD